MGRSSGRPRQEALRPAVLEAALALLESGEGMPTVAAICREAACTPPTLYHHWPDLAALLRDASATGWEQFRATQEVSATEPVERLRERGRAYVRFASSRPSLFRVLFLSGEQAEAQDDLAGTPLADLAADAVAAGLAAESALTLWAAVHGVATLAVTSRMPAAMVERLTEETMTAVLLGLAAMPRR